MTEENPLAGITVYDVRTFFYLWNHGKAKNGTEIARSYDVARNANNIREEMQLSHNYKGDYNNRHYYNKALENREIIEYDDKHYTLKPLMFDDTTKKILDAIIKINPEIIYLFYRKTKMSFLEWAYILVEKVGKPIVNNNTKEELLPGCKDYLQRRGILNLL